MPKTLLTALVTLLCSGVVTAQDAGSAGTGSGTPKAAKERLKFLEEIHVQAAATTSTNSATTAVNNSTVKAKPALAVYADSSSVIEDAAPLQFKFAVLLDTEVERLPSENVLHVLDQWMGTRYRLGGTDKTGIDCSSLTQHLFSSLFSIALPRTAREQYVVADKISRTEMRSGDLLFFNTTGGVSHVGMYLSNNKFIHASSSGGVMISDIFEDYWMRKFIAVGRISGVNPSLGSLRP